MEEIIKTNFKCLTSAFEITQYLRGRLFILVDCLLAREPLDPETEIPIIIGFFKIVIKVIVEWLKLFPSLIDSVNIHTSPIIVHRIASTS